MADVAEYDIDGEHVDVAEEDAGDGTCFFDLYWQGECINLGDPQWELPDEAAARAFLDAYRHGAVPRARPPQTTEPRSNSR
jgi:hypothetical protein